MKKWLYTILIMSTILILAACNTSNDTGGSKGSDKPNQVNDEEIVDSDKDKSDDKEAKKDTEDQTDNKTTSKTGDSKSKNTDSSSSQESKSAKDEKEPNNSKDTTKDNSEKEKPESNDTKDDIDYKKDSLFHYEMKSASNAYDVYIYSKDAKVQQTDQDWACEAAGEDVYVGDFSIVTIDKSNQAEQELNLGKSSFNKDREPVEIVNGQPDLLISSDCLSSDSFESDTYAIDSSGKMNQLKDKDGKNLDLNVTADLMKTTGKNTYQMAAFSNANEESNWLFYNLKLTESTHVMEIGEGMIPKNMKSFDMRKWKGEPNYLVEE